MIRAEDAARTPGSLMDACDREILTSLSRTTRALRYSVTVQGAGMLEL